MMSVQSFIKESYRAVLVRRGDPYRVIEVTERNMVSAFSELLHRSLGDMAPDSERKDKAARIRDLIRRLEAIKTAE